MSAIEIIFIDIFYILCFALLILDVKKARKQWKEFTELIDKRIEELENELEELQ